MPELIRLDILVQEPDFALAEALVAEYASAGWEEESLPTGETRLRVHAENRDVLEALAVALAKILPGVELSFGHVPDQDWMEAWRDFFTPVQAGDFLILPPWLKDTPASMPIIIEPKSAFGTGHHPTTTLCLKALTQLHADGVLHSGQHFLDLGTGTGILGMACVKYGLSGLGLDIDPLAIDNALENKERNGINAAFDVMPGSVEKAGDRTFDVVIANILAAPLVEMAPAIIAAVRPGGALVLSGFLDVQTSALEAAYASMGTPMRLAEASSVVTEKQEWVCLFWKGRP